MVEHVVKRVLCNTLVRSSNIFWFCPAAVVVFVFLEITSCGACYVLTEVAEERSDVNWQVFEQLSCYQ